MKVTRDLGGRIFYYMLLMRELENRLEKLYRQGKITGSVYVGRGQEAIPVGSAILTEPGDVVCPSHRDLGAYLIRGLEPKAVVANYLGRASSPTRGRDGNTHFGSLPHNIISYISSMAAVVPVAGGVALSFKYRRTRNVVLCYFGDGATSRGDWHEALNLAAVLKLPIVYVCNNNGYAYSTPVSRQMAVEHIAERGKAYGIPAARVDGNDVLAVYVATRRAIRRARDGAGPTLLECKTFRMAGHGAHESAEYVPQALRAKWAQRDPIALFERHLVSRSILDLRQIAELRDRVQREIDQAVSEAGNSSYPDPSGLLDGVFAEGVGSATSPSTVAY
ncbi:MAG: thiamine pyrophosphate-dependent dehydrogenase E1 component subunit alpha [Acidobacteria bacterium]|nr:thiamine pyrophosphate-dependent dehydrogenase E1 component subunit alpha [Acidobacteriota bacterium]